MPKPPPTPVQAAAQRLRRWLADHPAGDVPRQRVEDLLAALDAAGLLAAPSQDARDRLALAEGRTTLPALAARDGVTVQEAYARIYGAPV